MNSVREISGQRERNKWTERERSKQRESERENWTVRE